MHPDVETHRVQVAEICRRFGVRRLDVFGSAVGSGFDPQRSDVDLLVQFGESTGADPLEEYFGLKLQLETVLGRPVDLLVAGTVRNPYVLAGIESGRELIYAA